MLKIGDKIRRVNGDYIFIGRVVGVIKKWNRPLTTPTNEIRYVIQNYDGILHIDHERNLQVDDEQ